MDPMIRFIPLILSGVALNAAAQLLLRQGMLTVGTFSLDGGSLWQVLPRIALNPWVIAGLASYVMSVGLWLIVLSRVEVSVAYPMVSLGYVITVLLARVLFNEAVSWQRLLGVFIIICGVWLVARSGVNP
ncbi:MAG: EamA family transporter [Ardenticatenales bacterium]|nr:EamA family transporter [Ardenticatenales bacterium]